ncbi:MAG: S-methyl-5-thioribose-1-phosphate isomerase [Phycisphaerae bacterium]|nr:S-methyl-5-thioribose-1-phosphate isomerase [Gemmatimonadaceae bacterium]
MLPIPTVAWSPDGHAIRILDQTALPEREIVCELTKLDDIISAIRSLKVRGAPAIGVAAAMGLVVALEHSSGRDSAVAREQLPQCAALLIAARPTAVNLAWAVNRVVHAALSASDDLFFAAMRAEAQQVHDDDVAMCQRIGEVGLPLVADGARILTHCNAGALATAGIGTALAPIHLARQAGRRIHVFADETRPLRQGARLTAWELARVGIHVTVLPDSAAASLLRAAQIDLVIVGADRIAGNGDVANKVGTYPLALAAREHDVPFYVAAPSSTFDLQTPSGADIEIEQRSADELHPLPGNVSVYNPAFDITPAALVTAYITDHGLLHPPFELLSRKSA